MGVSERKMGVALKNFSGGCAPRPHASFSAFGAKCPPPQCLKPRYGPAFCYLLKGLLFARENQNSIKRKNYRRFQKFVTNWVYRTNQKKNEERTQGGALGVVAPLFTHFSKQIVVSITRHQVLPKLHGGK